MSPRIRRIVVLTLALVLFVGACGKPEEEPPQDEQSTFQLPTGFGDLQASTGPLCHQVRNTPHQMKLVNAEITAAGQILLVFETGMPFNAGTFETTVRSGDDEYTFTCDQVPDSDTRLYCFGSRLAEGATTEVPAQVQVEETSPFDIIAMAPELVVEFVLPEEYGLEKAWTDFYNCRQDPEAPGCDTLEIYAFPPERIDPSGEDDAPGIVLLWSTDFIDPDPLFKPVFAPTLNEDQLTDIEVSCVVGLRDLANQCAAIVFQPLEPEITALEDIMFLVEYVWEHFLNIYETVFVYGSHMGYDYDWDALDPDNWSYEELNNLDSRFDYYATFAPCLEFMTEGQACFEELGRPVVTPPNCATEASTAQLNQCIDDQGLGGFIDPVEAGDMQAWLDTIAAVEGVGSAENINAWFSTPEQRQDQYLEYYLTEEAVCISEDDLRCMFDYYDFLEEFAAYMLMATAPPECDPETPDSIWCQGADEDDPGTQLALGCGQEVGWTGALDTFADRAQLLKAVALGLPWVQDLGSFPNCLELYNHASLLFHESTGVPLQSPLVCASIQGTYATRTLISNFSVPYIEEKGTSGSGGGCKQGPRPDSDPCWIWDAGKCKWICFN